MKTDILKISSDGSNMETALEQVDKVSAYKELSPRDTLCLRLLAEETMAMMRAITGNVNGEFWMEDEDQVYTLHLRVISLVDEITREKLLSASTSGRNEATRGFMGIIRSFFEPSVSVPMFSAGISGGSPQMYSSYVWSMEDYKDQLRQFGEQNGPEAKAAWDELEKSVVGHLADDVRVSILGRTVEMTIVKKLA